MVRAAAVALALSTLVCAACTTTPARDPQRASPDGGANPPAASSDLTLTIVRVKSGASPAFVSAAIPFAIGELRASESLQIMAGTTELERSVRVLARWPDGSYRSVLVAFAPPSIDTESVTVRAVLQGNTAKVLASEPEIVRGSSVRAFAASSRWASTGALGLPFQLASAGTLAPAFFRRAAPVFQDVANPPSGANVAPHVRNYYDHTHALYMHMLALGPSRDLAARIDDEVLLYRENEIAHGDGNKGSYSAAPDTEATTPLDFNIVRRMYAQGLVEDYLVTGDARSLEVAKEIAEAFVDDVAAQAPFYPWTERIPAWTMLGLLPVFEATGNARYLAAARRVGDLAVAHQLAMAAKYPNQAGISGLTGSFTQDRGGQWFDSDESTSTGAGSPFMTTLLIEALVRLHRDTGDVVYLDSAANAARWIKSGCFVPGDDGTTVFTDDPAPDATDQPSLHHASFRYVCRASDNSTALPALNPMFAFALGVGWQRTGDESFRSVARDALSFAGWGATIKEYNQSLRSSAHGFLLLETDAGSFVPRQ